MRGGARHLLDVASRAARPALWLAGAMSLAAVGAYLMTPVAEASGHARASAQHKPRHATPFIGAPAVGALFATSHGKLGSHFCTASVVRSRAENLLITAAHCVHGKSPTSIIFAPGYHDGKFPRGEWIIRHIFVNNAWAQHQNPNDDVAFLIAGRPGTRVERHTGADVLKIDQRLGQFVDVIGYPDSTKKPITCRAPAYGQPPGYRQQVFRCDGFTNGTSGGPFLTHVNPKAGVGWVIGVVGGYENGGDSPNVSYAARFFSNIQRLYDAATASSGN